MVTVVTISFSDVKRFTTAETEEMLQRVCAVFHACWKQFAAKCPADFVASETDQIHKTFPVGFKFVYS